MKKKSRPPMARGKGRPKKKEYEIGRILSEEQFNDFAHCFDPYLKKRYVRRWSIQYAERQVRFMVDRIMWNAERHTGENKEYFLNHAKELLKWVEVMYAMA